ncbi:AMP phosphorylase [Thermoplasmatales archaeon SW_10_69_26]|nr:MAG: AMP phosphorylase [Thermoplasmatales archaeon SW_10_69_26]
MDSGGLTLSCQFIDLDLGGNQVVLHADDAEEIGVHPQHRVHVRFGDESLVAVVDTTSSVVEPGRIGVFPGVADDLGLEADAQLEVQPAEKPESVEFIRKKMNGRELDTDEIARLVEDMVQGSLTDIELSAYVTSVEIHDMNIRETTDLTRSMVETGEVIDFHDPMIFDKHSIGGVPGNKITLLVVPIAAAAGLPIPKTSSRAITGAAGTSDVMEVFCDVKLTAERIRSITNDVGGVMAWGGAVNLAPADDIIIRVEHPLSLDPRSLLLASVMAKKRAVGAKHVVIDIPMGPGSKIATMEEAKSLARDFIALGDRLGMQVECAITYGGQPVGKTVGPALEANEALRALRGDPDVPESFTKKATAIAGILLEMGGLARRGRGQQEAQRLLEDGSALETFSEIVQAQGGPEPELQPVGDHTWELVADKDGYVAGVGNRDIVAITRSLGAPKVKGAGVELPKKEGDSVEEGETLLKLYAESEYKLEAARKLATSKDPVTVEGMLLERVPEFREIGDEPSGPGPDPSADGNGGIRQVAPEADDDNEADTEAETAADGS